MDADAAEGTRGRPQARQFVALLIITTATAQALGLALKLPSQLGANDISRYCTVWSLLERGTFAIDDCPWQKDTQDKVNKPEPFSKESPAASDCAVAATITVMATNWRAGGRVSWAGWGTIGRSSGWRISDRGSGPASPPR